MKHQIAAVLILCHHCDGFSHPSSPSTQWKTSSMFMNPLDSPESNQSVSRRYFAKSIAASLFSAGAFSAAALSNPALSSAESTGATIWKTGKAPEVPGQTPKDKSDTKGTRKDPNFLRSIADCKGKCENSPGPDGLARSSAECLSACQDICCTTYEQCTFAIIAR